MKTLSQIEKIIYSILKGSEVVDLIDGSVYYKKRPSSSKKTDIVINARSGSVSVYQQFVVDVNVYCKDIVTNNGNVINPLLETIEEKCAELFEHIDQKEYFLKYDDAPSYIEIEQTKEHMLNNRLLVTHQNF